MRHADFLKKVPEVIGGTTSEILRSSYKDAKGEDKMKDLILTNQNLTMSSRNIAELTGKEHSDLLRDIRVQFAELYDIEKDDANLHDKLKQHLSIEF